MKKILNIFILLLLMFTATYSAKDTFYEAEYVPNIFIKMEGSKYLYQQAKALRKSSDRSLVYCIEPWEIVNNNVIYEKGVDVNTLNDETLEKLSLIAYYGYNYKDHKDIKWYFISQIAMWRVLEPHSNFYFTDSLNGNKTNKYESELNELMNLVNNHHKRPDFGGSQFSTPSYKSLILTDKNKVLDQYNISTNLNYKVENNKLILNTNGNNRYTVTFTKKDTLYNHPPILYKSSNSQNMLLTGSFKDIEDEIKVYSSEYTTIIEKVSNDEENIDFTGTKFLLTNKIDFEEEFILESNEHIFTNLIPGTYYLKELSTIKGYKVNEEEFEFEVFDITNSIITIGNDLIKKNIKIIKYYESDELKLEKDVFFEIIGENYYKKIKTDEFGEINITLPYGKYTVKQITSTYGYDLVEDFIINVEDDQDEEIILINKPILTNLKIIKTDVANNPIKNNKAYFKLTNKLTKEVFYKYTNDDGYLIFENLMFGTYILEEINAPKGYSISKETYEIVISEEQFLNDISELVIHFSNEEIIYVPETSKYDYKINIVYYDDKKKKL